MRILLADDEVSLSRALLHILDKNNFSADAVYNGEDALAYLETGTYDAAILDVMMPKMDGITVLQNSEPGKSHSGYHAHGQVRNR